MAQLRATRTAILAAAVFALFAAPAWSALPVPTSCQSDVQGANDQPGQKDVTEFCVDLGNNSPFELHTSMSLDLVTLPGGNTADVCTLFDTDNDGNVNLAACVTLIDGGNPASLGEIRLFTCADTRPDRCTTSVQVNLCTGGASCLVTADCPMGQTCSMQFDTDCEVSQQNTDPFVTGTDYPVDSVAVCAIDLDDFGIPNARIIDACSYPSTIPNSDPSDCILFQGCTLAAQCNDGNPCTIDACSPAGICTHTPDTGTACDDGDACTVGTTCSSLGFCDGGSALTCNDNNACTTDTCNVLTGCVFTPTVNGSPCEDGLFCTVSDACVAGACVGAPRSCGDGIACTTDICNELTDQCQHTANDAVCSNGLFCDGVETCNVITGCQPGTPVNCNDNVACTTDGCNETLDQCVNTPVHSVCSNGLFCDGVELCSPPFGCVAGPAVDCSDGIACTVDACNEATDQCDHTANHAACSNGQFCDGNEVCNPLAGCEPGPAVDCTDAVACTVDSCNEVTDSCVHTPNHAVCANGLFCDGNEVCDPLLGCQSGTPVDCNDSIACTVDVCNEASDACVHTPNHVACDNGLFCDGVEVCDVVDGCEPGPDPCLPLGCSEPLDICLGCTIDAQCDDGLFCNGTETCNPGTGNCNPGTPVNCADAVPCTIDSCNEATDLCIHTPDDGSCSNGLFCDGAEICNPVTGCGPGLAVNCADAVACTADVCDEGADQCIHAPNHAACSNGQFCDGNEICDPILGCQGVPPVNCGDGVACTLDTCNELTDSCDHIPQPALCSDGQFCNGAELCLPLADCAPGTPTACSDGITCTIDACNEATDSCDHTPNNGSCSNGQFCDGNEVCDPMTGCHSGTPVDCDDSDACTIDTCNESINQCQQIDQCCGDGDLDPGEQCEPPNLEDCNNGIDDDGDGRADCRDVDCADPNNPLVGIVTCGLDCRLDMPCTKIRRDPAFITFGKDGRPDRLRIHGRFRLSSAADPLAEGMSFSLTNDYGSIYRGALLPGDLKASGTKFVFKDATAPTTGVGIRDGIASVRIKFHEFEGEPYLNFILIVYGDLSAATDPWMTSQIVVGNDTGFLRAQWILLKNGWKLHDKTFF